MMLSGDGARQVFQTGLRSVMGFESGRLQTMMKTGFRCRGVWKWTSWTIPNSRALCTSIDRANRTKGSVLRASVYRGIAWDMGNRIKVSPFSSMTGIKTGNGDGRLESEDSSPIARALKRDSLDYFGDLKDRMPPFEWDKDVKKLGSKNDLDAYYNFGKVIGHGTFGVVHVATSLKDGKEYAIKSNRKRLQPHFKREVILSSRVKHPSVISPVEVFETKDEVFIVTEYCRGGELFDFVAEHNLYLGTCDEETVLEITREMLIALEACHKAEYSHLDVKLENFVCRIPWTEFLTDPRNVRGNIALIDFGTAQPFRLKPYATTSDEYDKNMDDVFRGETPLGGTASYVSPEVLNGRFSSRSDLWSLGVCLFMLIAGRRPFDTSFDASPSVFDRDVQINIQKEAALPLGESLYSTCAELGLATVPTVDLLLTMMHPDPSMRKSATELIAIIDHMLEEHRALRF